MEILEILILLALTFGGSIIKLVTERKKKNIINENSSDQRDTAPTFRDIILKEFDLYTEEKEESADDFEIVSQEESFIPREENFIPQKEEAFIPREKSFIPQKEDAFIPQEKSFIPKVEENLPKVEKRPQDESDHIYEQNDDTDNEYSPIYNLNEADELKKAFIYSEILKPKF